MNEKLVPIQNKAGTLLRCGAKGVERGRTVCHGRSGDCLELKDMLPSVSYWPSPRLTAKGTQRQILAVPGLGTLKGWPA